MEIQNKTALLIIDIKYKFLSRQETDIRGLQILHPNFSYIFRPSIIQVC